MPIRPACHGLSSTTSAGVPATHLTPATWKRAVGIAPGKDETRDSARSEAIRRWPDKEGLFALKMDDGRAEAENALDDATATAKGSRWPFPRSRADIPDKGMTGMGAMDQLGQERRIDGGTAPRTNT